MIYSDNIFKTFYLCLTNKCNLNCEYCYIHKKDKTDQKDVMELGDMIYAIKSANPQYVIITGGEPLLYPNQIIALQRSFKVNDSCHWNTTLCSNLYYKELTKKQLEAISMVDSLQTSYSIDRELIDEDIVDIIGRNIETIRKNCKNIKNISVIWTITPNQLNHYFKDECDKLLSLDINGIQLEAISYTSDINFNWDAYYQEFDNYALKCCKYIPEERNDLYWQWSSALDNHLNSLHCNICNLGCAVTYENNKLMNRCNCIIEKVERKDKFRDYCLDCDLYKYCKMDCERFGNYCGFPKKTFKYYMEKIRKEEIKP